MTPSWIVEGSKFRYPLQLHPELRSTAEAYVAHRLRLLRARDQVFRLPLWVDVRERDLCMELPAAADSSANEILSYTKILELALALVDCHQQRVVGLRGDGDRWLPPVGWFLPPPPDVALDFRADLLAAAAWLGTSKAAGPLTKILKEGDGERLAGWLREEQQHHLRQQPSSAASFLSLLTEGELMERVAGTYRYRRLRPEEADSLGLDRREVIEVDPAWQDPHFPPLTRPSPQEVWDALTEESRVTPVLALSPQLPNPLSARLSESVPIRWIGVHADQPFMYIRSDGGSIPSRGYVRLHLAGDNVLMDRKRSFTRFSGLHASLQVLLSRPPPVLPFKESPQPRDVLEDKIVATRGIFAVQGPPGTGKTHLATQVVRRYLVLHPYARVLVCAKEHYALDHILTKIINALQKDGLPVRAWRSVSLARRRRGKSELEGTWQSPAVLRDLSARRWQPEAAGWAAWEGRASDEHDQRLATLGCQSANLFFATTMDGSMVELLGQASFDLVIVEEAGKCYPSELLHALCLGRTSLMIGDQRQLPPYQEQRTREGVEAWRQTLRKAFRDDSFREEVALRLGAVFVALEDLAERRGPPTEEELSWLRPFSFLFDRLPTRHRLEEQFRMEAPLSRVIGSVFYDRPFQHRKGELLAAGLLSARPLGCVLPKELDVPLLWLDTPHMMDHPQATEDDQKRGIRDNRYELEVILAYLRRLQPRPPLDMVILTPYNAQKRLLLDSTELKLLCEKISGLSLEQVVRTTDEYQGREAELTILSLVRNNSLGARAWGFMTEPERLNVMFSRTRFRQVVVGCSAHIRRHAKECEWLNRVWEAYQREAEDPTNARILPAGALHHG